MAGENGSHDGPDSVFEAPPKEPMRDGKDTDSSALDENSEWAQVGCSIDSNRCSGHFRIRTRLGMQVLNCVPQPCVQITQHATQAAVVPSHPSLA